MSHDVIVIGAGPAGLAAARAVGERGFGCLVIDRMGPGGQLMNMGEVYGLPQLAAGATGPDLIGELLDAAMGAGVELAVDEVTAVAGPSPWRAVGTDQTYAGRALIIATGLAPGTTGLVGEARYLGNGLSHCAMCDGPLFAGKRVVVDGDGEWAARDAIELAALCAHVTLVESGAGAVSAARIAELAALGNVTRVTGRIAALDGAGALGAVQMETPAGRQELPAAALFLAAGRRPASAILGDRARLAASGHITVDAQMMAGTGLYACGDVRQGSPERIAAALEDGRIAGVAAADWIAAQR